MDDHSQAISFANSYFSLVDGLAPGLDDHLAENVVLDWFGRTIRGRKNVAEFMKTHKVASRHVFNAISPVACINYRKYQTNRKLNPIRKTDNYVSTLLKNDLKNFENLSIEDSSAVDPENNNVSKAAADYLDPCNETFDSDGNKTEETYELGENDLSNLFATSEISPTSGEEDIENDISRMIKMNEKLLSNDKYDWKTESDGSINRAIKYVEANGQIEFSKKSNKRGTDLQTWRRQSQIQMAYSLITMSELPRKDEEILEDDDDEFNGPMETNVSLIFDGNRNEKKLPSLGEITEISNNLIPNINNFGGYFPYNFDFISERDDFLENFNAELTERSSTSFLRTPHYVDNRLVFPDANSNKPKEILKDINKLYEGNGFVFNYLIHLIIYQGNSKCRRSLNQEFDFSNKNNKRFHSKEEF